MVDFGDTTTATNPVLAVSKAWSTPGVKELVFTAWNDNHPDGVTLTQRVTAISLADSTIYVSNNGSDANSGTSWAEAKATINAGVDAQKIIGGRVLVADGSYGAVGSYYNPINVPIRLSSVNGPTNTTIQGDGTDSCLTIGDVKAIVSGFTIRGGKANEGAGVFCKTKLPMISNCVITECETSGNNRYGGGIYRGTVYNSVITNNTALNKDDLYQSIGVNCLIVDNVSTSDGGGAYSCRLTACTLKNNRSDSAGGGAAGGEAHSCLIIGNSVSYTTITEGQGGGGISEGDAYNCTIIYNVCGTASRGGGVQGKPDKYATIYNCIIYGNTTKGSAENIRYVTAYNSCSPDFAPGVNPNITSVEGNIASAPIFANPAIGDYRLLITSPCINAGNNAFVFSTQDYGNQSRISGKMVDIGAYEYQLNVPFLSVSKQQIHLAVAQGNSPLSSFFEIFNSGDVGTMDYSVSTNAGWLSCTPASGSCTDDERDTITITNGIWSGAVKINADGEFRIQATNSTDGAFALSNPFDITEDGR